MASGEALPKLKATLGVVVDMATQLGSTLLLKPMVPTLSETGPLPPFVMVTQIGGSLVGLVGLPQPVWKRTGTVAVLLAVML